MIMIKVFLLPILLLTTSILFAQKPQRGYIRMVEKTGQPAQHLSGCTSIRYFFAKMPNIKHIVIFAVSF
jgi:hypothetical protein